MPGSGIWVCSWRKGSGVILKFGALPQLIANYEIQDVEILRNWNQMNPGWKYDQVYEEHKMDAKLEDYISYRQSNDSWRMAILLVDNINSVNIERFASISADR